MFSSFNNSVSEANLITKKVFRMFTEKHSVVNKVTLEEVEQDLVSFFEVSYQIVIFNTPQSKNHKSNYSPLTKRLLKIKVGETLVKETEAYALEKYRRTLQAPPYNRYTIDQIFNSDSIQKSLNEDAKITAEDRIEVIKKCEEVISNPEYEKKILEQIDILINPTRFAANYLENNAPMLFNALLRYFNGEESDARWHVKSFNEEKKFTISLYLTTDHDHYYNKKFTLLKYGFIEKDSDPNWCANLVGIRIGPFTYEWNSTGVVVPVLFSTFHHKSTIYLQSNELHKEVQKEKIIESFSKAICSWNKACYAFKEVADQTSSNRNSLHFCHYILEALGIEPEFLGDGPIARYFSRINNGTLGGKTILFNMNGEEVEITSHNQLKVTWDGTSRVWIPDKGSYPGGGTRIAGLDLQAQREYEALARCIERCMQLCDGKTYVEHPIHGDYTGKVSPK
jgi:hypothetical protein